MRVEEGAVEPTQTQADDRATELIAEEIAELDISSVSMDAAVDGEEVPPELSVAFLDTLGPFPRDSGIRQQAWPNSPVKSARF